MKQEIYHFRLHRVSTLGSIVLETDHLFRCSLEKFLRLVSVQTSGYLFNTNLNRFFNFGSTYENFFPACVFDFLFSGQSASFVTTPVSDVFPLSPTRLYIPINTFFEAPIKVFAGQDFGLFVRAEAFGSSIVLGHTFSLCYTVVFTWDSVR